MLKGYILSVKVSDFLKHMCLGFDRPNLVPNHLYLSNCWITLLFLGEGINRLKLQWVIIIISMQNPFSLMVLGRECLSVLLLKF